jgi:hypothetical protein
MKFKILLTKTLIFLTRRGGALGALAAELNVGRESVVTQAARLNTISITKIRVAVLDLQRKDREEAEQKKVIEAQALAEFMAAARRAREAEERRLEIEKQRKLATFVSSLPPADRKTWDEIMASVTKEEQKTLEGLVLQKMADIDTVPRPTNDQPAGARLSSGR